MQFSFLKTLSAWVPFPTATRQSELLADTNLEKINQVHSVAQAVKEESLGYNAKALTSVSVRVYQQQDRAALRKYFDALSMETRFKRLHATSIATPDSVLNLYVARGAARATEANPSASVVQTVNTVAYRRYCCVAYPTELSGLIVGEAILAIDPIGLPAQNKQAEIGLSTGDEFLRKGIATALLENIETVASTMGIEQLYANAYRSNTGFVRFAQSHGYEIQSHQSDRALVRLVKDFRGLINC